jgi:MFS family permease
MSGVNGFHRPALDAMLPRLVDREDLTAIAALRMFSFSTSAIAGPALGGVCIATLGYSATYLIDVLTFVISLVALTQMRSMPAPQDAAIPSIQTIVDGLKYARNRPELVGTYVVDMVAMTFAMPMALFPAIASVWSNAAAAGWLYSALSVGSLLTSVLSGWTSRVQRHGAAVVIAATLWGVAIIGFGFSPNLYGALAFLALAGAADAVSGLFRMTIWNETIPAGFRGRLAGVEMISYLSGPLLGNARAGWIASISSNVISVVSGGVICVAAVLLCIPILPQFWTYRVDSRSRE